MKIILVILVYVILLSAKSGLSETSQIANKVDALTSIAWERTFNDQYCKIALATLNPKSKELVIAGHANNFTTDIQRNKGIWLWKINEIGNKVADVSIKNITIGKATYKLDQLKAMLVNEDGSIWLIAEANITNLLIKTNFVGDILLSKEIDAGINVSKALSLLDNGLLVIGSIKGKTFFMKFDASGKELWRKISSRNEYGKFYDGIPTKDGGFILVENSGAPNDFVFNTTKIYISYYNAVGEKQNEKYLSGQFGSIATGLNDTYSILYDKKPSEGQDYWIQVYDKDLNPKWNLNVATTMYAIANFKMNSLQNGNYIITGEKIVDDKTLVNYIDTTGVIRWEYTGKTFVYGTDIICSNTVCYLIEAVSNTLDTQGADIIQVKVIKFQPQ